MKERGKEMKKEKWEKMKERIIRNEERRTTIYTFFYFVTWVTASSYNNIIQWHHLASSMLQ